jgi:hypothetical protein
MYPRDRWRGIAGQIWQPAAAFCCISQLTLEARPRMWGRRWRRHATCQFAHRHPKSAKLLALAYICRRD